MIVKVSAVNFLSWAELEFEVPNTIALIEGWNFDDGSSEGSGKSAILNAICWGLYGSLPKAANIDEVIRSGEKSCVVDVEFADGTHVVRTRKPNGLYMTSADGEKILGKDAKETQTLIETYVGLTFDTFCQTAYFAQNYGKKFLTATNEEKSKILAEVQDLTLFDKARKLAKERAKQAATTNAELRTQYSVANAKLSGEAKLQATLEQTWKNEERDKALRIERLKASEARHQMRLAEVENKLKNIPDLDTAFQAQYEAKNKYSQAYDHLTTVQRESDLYSQNEFAVRQLESRNLQTNRSLENYKKALAKAEKNQVDLETFLTNPVAPCPTCGTTIQHSDLSEVQAELEAWKSQINDLAQSIERESNNILSTNEQIKDMKGLSKPNPQALLDARSLEEQARQELYKASSALELARSAQDGQSEKQNLLEELADLKKQIEREIAQPLQKGGQDMYEASVQQSQALQAEIAEITEAINASRAKESSLLKLSESFVAVKNSVFESLLSELNYRVAALLEVLFEVPVTLEFQNVDQKIELSLELDGQPRGLGLLSGGQFRRVNLAVDLALADIIHARKNSKLGLLMIDEYMKDLSEESMYKCLELLKKRNMPILLIEHNSIIRSAFDQTYKVGLKAGVSEFLPA